MRVHWNTWGRVSQTWKRDEKEMMRFGAFVIIGDYNVDASGCADKPWKFQCAMHNGFPTGKMEQTIMTSLCDIMRISHAEKGRELYKESMTEPWGCCYCHLDVFWYKAFGLVSKPQTLYLSCLGALQGGSITRMNLTTYLSICKHPDLSGGFSVSYNFSCLTTTG